ncbi:MAG: hypothetical protein ACREQ4_03360 [Candidatus Binataceae bacterium]
MPDGTPDNVDAEPIEQRRNDNRRNIALALLGAGLGTLAARGRYAPLSPLQALAQGGLEGLQIYGASQEAERKERDRQQQATLRLRQIGDERNYRNSMLGMENQRLGLENQRLNRPSRPAQWKQQAEVYLPGGITPETATREQWREALNAMLAAKRQPEKPQYFAGVGPGGKPYEMAVSPNGRGGFATVPVAPRYERSPAVAAAATRTAFPDIAAQLPSMKPSQRINTVMSLYKRFYPPSSGMPQLVPDPANPGKMKLSMGGAGGGVPHPSLREYAAHLGVNITNGSLMGKPGAATVPEPGVGAPEKKTAVAPAPVPAPSGSEAAPTISVPGIGTGTLVGTMPDGRPLYRFPDGSERAPKAGTH